MKRFIFILLAFIISIPLFAQNFEVNVALDTVSYYYKSNDRTWFKGTLKDTIVGYKKITIDSIVYSKKSLKNDTLFFIQYYEKGWRYINDTLRLTDYDNQKCGYLFKNKMVGLWDLTEYPTCFDSGTLTVNKHQFYDGEMIQGKVKDKLY